MDEAERLAAEKYPDEIVQSQIAYDDDFIRPQTAKKLAFAAGFRAGEKSEKVLRLVEALERIGPSTEENSNFSRSEDECAFYIRIAVEALASFNASPEGGE